MTEMALGRFPGFSLVRVPDIAVDAASPRSAPAVTSKTESVTVSPEDAGLAAAGVFCAGNAVAATRSSGKAARTGRPGLKRELCTFRWEARSRTSRPGAPEFSAAASGSRPALH